MEIFEPVIKWSGSKRSVCRNIVSHFPKEIDTYYEPFCGGASVLRALLESDIKVNKYVCSDLNKDLIDLWKKVKNHPLDVSAHYSRLWKQMNCSGLGDDKEYKKYFYNGVRERFNDDRNPLDFMFICRTCVNGLPRYNSKGKYNSPFHITRDGIQPERLDRIIKEWSEWLWEKDVQFECRSYDTITPQEGDFIYLDPPYAATKGMYFGGFDNNAMFEWLRGVPCRWILSYDGKSGDNDRTYPVPEDLYDEHKYIKSGKSSFKRLVNPGQNVDVYESLYIKK